MRRYFLISSLRIVIWMGLALPRAQAAEEIIPITIHNNYWSNKTRFSGIVTYKHNLPNAELNLILEGGSEPSPKSTAYLTVTKGLVKSIQVFLTNYHEETTVNILEETLLAGLTFSPIPSSVLSITFTIDAHTIEHKVTYSLPPLFFN
jgi:hypothetical protein